ncbi:MAG: hypothetical protein PHR43_02735 [Dehalococcoidales bacterium]|nr:hypothetical protein [Dehalococcoidales bacterium]
MARKQNGKVNAALQELLANLEVTKIGVADLAKAPERLAAQVRKLLPEARSVVVLEMEMYPEIVELTRPERIAGAASLNDLLDRHMDFLNSRATKAAHDVARVSHELGFKALPLPAFGCPGDARFLDAVLSYKHAAEAAGLGTIGWNSLLITPEFGPRVRLACCLTEAALEPTAGQKMTDVCTMCGVCIKKCPSKSLAKPGKGETYRMNKYSCLTFRSAAGGCAECVKVCPVGR